jgi:hypothetical protein
VPHTTTCSLLGVSLSWFYMWLGRTPTPRERHRCALDVAVADAFKTARGEHGSPRLHADLREASWTVSEKTVADSMRRQGLVAPRIRRRSGLTRQVKTAPKFPDLLKTGIHCHRAQPQVGRGHDRDSHRGRQLYLATVIDLFSRRLLGAATGLHPNAELACAAIEMAVAARGGTDQIAGVISHTDLGYEGERAAADHADQEEHRRAADRRSAHRQPAARGHPSPGRTRQLPAQDDIQGAAPGQPLPLAHRRDHRRRPRSASSPAWPDHMITDRYGRYWEWLTIAPSDTGCARHRAHLASPAGRSGRRTGRGRARPDRRNGQRMDRPVERARPTLQPPLGPFAVWEVLHNAALQIERDGRSDRHIVVVARQANDSQLSAWTWSRGDDELTPFARYLLHAAMARYELRVWAATPGVSTLRGESGRAITPLLRLAYAAAATDRKPGLDELFAAATTLAGLQARELGLADRATRLRDLRRTVTVAAANMTANAHGDHSKGLFADEKEILAWFDQQVDHDLTY